MEPSLPHADTFLTHLLMYTLLIPQSPSFHEVETTRDLENTTSSSMSGYLTKCFYYPVVGVM